jgi:hypothetical protein
MGLAYVWFIFAWAILFAFIRRGDPYYEGKWTLVGSACWASVNAGF